MNFSIHFGIRKRWFVMAFVYCGMCTALWGQTPPRPPNIVVILVDDLGYGEVSSNGCPDYMTPNIDRLGADGVRFTNGYATHFVCSPSRAALLTGRYPHRWGHEQQPDGDNSNPRLGMPRSELTLAEI